MSHEIVRSLPSLACPSMMSLAQGAGKDEKPLHLPPFPDIDLRNWAGFTFSHLRWVGFMAPNLEGRIEARKYVHSWQQQVPIVHELFHKNLAHTPFSQVKRFEIWKFYNMILEILDTFKEGNEGIRVPVLPDVSGNDLEKAWAIIVNLQDASWLLEEVYAVRSSVLHARKNHLISNDLRNRLIIEYKAEYEKIMSGFSVVYNIFDCIVKKIGENFANGLIFSVLATLNPTVAFCDIVSGLFDADPRVATKDFLWEISDEEAHSVANLSYEEAYYGFSHLMDELDPDDSCYRKRKMMDVLAVIKERSSLAARENKSDFEELLLGSPTEYLVSHYNKDIHRFGNAGGLKPSYGSNAILIEAIRQQLTKGIGLFCPFWRGKKCCSLDNRALLEKVWYCTSPYPGWQLWMRGGCLEKAEARVKRQVY